MTSSIMILIGMFTFGGAVIGVLFLLLCQGGDPDRQAEKGELCQ